MRNEETKNEKTTFVTPAEAEEIRENAVRESLRNLPPSDVEFVTPAEAEEIREAAAIESLRESNEKLFAEIHAEIDPIIAARREAEE